MTNHVVIADLLRCLKEGTEALDAFEKFCADYKDHSISPRLIDWRKTAVRLLDTPRGRS